MSIKIFLAGVFSASVTFAGNAQVTGFVKEKSGEPIVSANVIWDGTSSGTSTGINGEFSIPENKTTNKLIVSFLGFKADTVVVDNPNKPLNIVLEEAEELKEVEVVARKSGTTMSSGLLNQMNISSAELVRAACCNLGESFTTNPSVDVSYSDAATGAKQIKLLGLSGSYVQMLLENVPEYRGAAMPYSLGYVPGTWMQSIQVSKGSSSVKNGYESITGQINVELKKPQDNESVTANVYGSSKSRFEANAEANLHINDRLSTGLLAHYEDNFGNHDDNDDGFLDSPKVRQYNFMNRWMWTNNKYVFQAAVNALKEDRRSGQTEHGGHAVMNPEKGMYKINIGTERYDAFAKNAYIFNPEKMTNMALILSGSMLLQDAAYGMKTYDVNQKNFYASLLFETNLAKKHNLSTGLSFIHDYYGQQARFVNDINIPATHFVESENVPGAYAQYTFNLDKKLIAMAGVRADYSSEYGFFVTPRVHVKYSPSEAVSIRASAGKGYRSVHPLAEYNYLLAVGRNIRIDKPEQEAAWNYGLSTSFKIPLFGKNLDLNAEYYYTDFQRQSIVDYESNPDELRITNLRGKSYSHTFQVDASYPLFRGMTFTAAYRWNDVKTTYSGKLMEKPLTSRYKALVTASYLTPLEKWQFDVTFQMNGGGRLPLHYADGSNNLISDGRYPAFGQLSAQITRWFKHWSIYVGGENLTNYRQRNLILGATTPWGTRFDPTQVWGPVHGAMVYAGIRINFAKKKKLIPMNMMHMEHNHDMDMDMNHGMGDEMNMNNQKN